MKSMKLSKKDVKELSEPVFKDDGPQYPYGLQITLDKEQLETLGIDDLPKVGTKMKIEALVNVSAVSQNKSLYGEHKSMSLQITDLALSDSGNEEE